MRLSSLLMILTVLFLISGCNAQEKSAGRVEGRLDWAKGCVWYQIFPERFYNGDEANDPALMDVPVEQRYPEWRAHSWTSDWYEIKPWELTQSNNFYDGKVVYSRYCGGDLVGVIKKLDYLKDLGIDAIYFNPVFEAESLHKYDGASYHHIDDNFGRNPERDRKRLAEVAETENPATWIWTSADSVFLKLLKEAHARDIKVVIDGVFNHTGRAFFAFQDIIKNGENSRYIDWYTITAWDDPATEANEFDYKAWWGVKTLPELAEDKNGLVSGPREYVLAATKRWLDPNGDGDPEDGIDGWRLDVLNEVAAPFWQEWTALVRSINPHAITVAEIWDDASYWINECGIDNTMNYLAARAMVEFFINQKKAITGTEFAKRLRRIVGIYGEETSHLLWNLTNSHDTDRIASMIMNPDRDFDRDASLRDNPKYNINKPTERARRIQKQIFAFQTTFIGAPLIYYGDEAGMWGDDDPNNRTPMVWSEMDFEIEKSHPIPGRKRLPSPKEFDSDLFNYYKKMIGVRHQHSALKNGSLQILDEGTGKYTISFLRRNSDEEILILFNADDENAEVSIPVKYFKNKTFIDFETNKSLSLNGTYLQVMVPERWYKIVKIY